MPFSGRPTVYHVEALDPNLTLVEVNGHLQDSAIGRWTALLNGVIAEGAARVVVDLRGCTTIDSACQSALVHTSSTIKAKANGGVRLVTFAGSPVDDEFGGPAGELPVHSSVQEARMCFQLE